MRKSGFAEPEECYSIKMNLNSPLFDRIRVKQDKDAPKKEGGPLCDHPGCKNPGPFRAPKGRLRENEYFQFCWTMSKNTTNLTIISKGMTDDDLARYQKDAVYGHRPTWSMGVKRGATVSARTAAAGAGKYSDPFGMFSDSAGPAQQKRQRHPGWA